MVECPIIKLYKLDPTGNWDDLGTCYFFSVGTNWSVVSREIDVSVNRENTGDSEASCEEEGVNNGNAHDEEGDSSCAVSVPKRVVEDAVGGGGRGSSRSTFF